jgi:hypothetical protein
LGQREQAAAGIPGVEGDQGVCHGGANGRVRVRPIKGFQKRRDGRLQAGHSPRVGLGDRGRCQPLEVGFRPVQGPEPEREQPFMEDLYPARHREVRVRAAGRCCN